MLGAALGAVALGVSGPVVAALGVRGAAALAAGAANVAASTTALSAAAPRVVLGRT